MLFQKESGKQELAPKGSYAHANAGHTNLSVRSMSQPGQQQAAIRGAAQGLIGSGIKCQ